MKENRWLCALLVAALLAGMAVPALALEKGRLLRVANCGGWAAMRWYPGADAGRVAKVPKGALVVYGGVTEGGYRLVRYGAQEGYVGVGYLVKQNRALRTDRSVWLTDRKGQRLKKLGKGALLVAMSGEANGSFRVYWNGHACYVDSTALRAASTKSGKKAVTLRALALRAGAGSGSKKVCAVPQYAGVYCYGVVGESVYACYGGKYGFLEGKGLWFK